MPLAAALHNAIKLAKPKSRRALDKDFIQDAFKRQPINRAD